MKLVLLRHGESEWNLENRFTGWTDVDLSDNGRKEALSAGKALLDGGYDFDICYTSYLKRAIHTLDAVLDVMQQQARFHLLVLSQCLRQDVLLSRFVIP